MISKEKLYGIVRGVNDTSQSFSKKDRSLTRVMGDLVDQGYHPTNLPECIPCSKAKSLSQCFINYY